MIVKKLKRDKILEIKDEELKKKYKKFELICDIIAIVDKYYFEKRAAVLKRFHPLALQFDINTGVANGVLVVRSEKECAELLYRILTNSLKFTIKGEKGFTILQEEISKMPFRVVTDNTKLTKAFWRDYP